MIKQPVRTNVSDFIKTTMGSQFVIPVYQRNYTWNPAAETARFMNDVEDLLNDRNTSHFLGILIYKEFDRSSMQKELSIVDGQQRLTTSFIFLLCLKHAAMAKKDKDTAGIIEDYYLYNRHASADARLRLKPTVSNDDTFERLIDGNAKDLSRHNRESNVFRNYEYIYQRIQEMNRRFSLIDILDTLTRFDILAFPLSDADDSQQIFESINSTGAPLTSADLIRNYVLMNDPNDIQERNYRLYWQPLENNYPASRKLEEFFRIYLAAKTYSYLPRRDVYEGFKSFWNASDQGHEDTLKDINRYCRYYYTLYSGPCENEQVEKVLRDFRRNESRIPAPFLMEMFHLYDEGLIDARTFCAQVTLIDSYLMRRALCGMDNGSLSRYFPQLLRSVMSTWRKKHRNIHEITKVFLINYNRGKSMAMPTDKQLRSRLREINAYSLMCIRPVLERIEHNGATAEVDTSDLNIEHIMPQHPNNWWKRTCGAKDDEEYTFYANLIGNLTLCAEYDNTRMGNQDFQFKKKILRQTMHIRMNTELLERETWTVQDILNRCDRLTRQIIAIFPYEGGNDTLSDERDDDIIVLNTPNINARALYVNPQCIEILAGSTMQAYRANEMKTMRTLYHDMTEKGVLFEDENGMVQFDKNLRFSDLNTAAQFLLHRGGDNTGAWTREDGTVFLQKKAPEKIPEKPKSSGGPKKDTAGQKTRSGRSSTKARKEKRTAEEQPRHTKTGRTSSAGGRKPAKKQPPQKSRQEASKTKETSQKQASAKKQTPVKKQESTGRQPEHRAPSKAEVRTYKKGASGSHGDLKPQKTTPQEKKSSFLQTLFGLKPKD